MGTAQTWTLQSSVPCGHQHGLASFQGSRDWSLAQLPLTLLEFSLHGKVFKVRVWRLQVSCNEWNTFPADSSSRQSWLILGHPVQHLSPTMLKGREGGDWELPLTGENPSASSQKDPKVSHTLQCHEFKFHTCISPYLTNTGQPCRHYSFW